MPGWHDPKTPNSWHFPRPISTRIPSPMAAGRRRQYWILSVVVIITIFLFLYPTQPQQLSVETQVEEQPQQETPSNPEPTEDLPEERPPPINVNKTHWPDPPSFEKLKEWERNLPQHNLDLPAPEGRKGRYVKFSNQVKRLGWNNALNEILMNTHLAYESKRTYVFQPFIWKEEHYSWPIEKMREVPPSTPLNAIISGPSAGGPWDEGDGAARSVSSEFFEAVCPPSQRRVVNSEDVKPDVARDDGIDVFNHWKKFLVDAPEPCIEIVPAEPDVDFYPQTFDLWLWGSKRILSLWESFSKSPASRLLEPSPIVKSAVERNAYLFLPRGPSLSNSAPRDPYKRMLSVHVRRGDYSEACLELAKWNSTFYSWNLLKILPDTFTPPPGGKLGNNTPENTAQYLKHCLPQFDDIVQKVQDSRRDYLKQAKDVKNLDIIYLLTDERGEWLDRLKETLHDDGWHTIVTSRDLELDQEQTEVNMAVDMEIARRSAVFIGNGWSSFTSNIVHKRLIDGKLPITCRFY